MTELAGAVAFVTGGGGGIGGAIAAHLTAAGSVVTTADLAGRGGDVAVDVTDASAVEAATHEVVQRHSRLDVVVAVAGVGVGGLLEELSLDDWHRAVDVNLWGTVHTVRAAYPHMVAAGRGHIVLLASASGILPTPLLVPYATSKAATVGLGASLRPEAARHGIQVTTVCPGPVDTVMLATGGEQGVVHNLDVRRYLERAAGPALSPDAVAKATLRGIRRNRAMVTPGRVGVAWRAARLSPGLAERMTARAMRAELADRKP